MVSVISKIKHLLKRHSLVLAAAVFVGAIYGGPHIWFAATNDAYQGLPLMQSANEDYYVARIQEIIDGYPLIGSQGFFEYKSEWPLSPPTGEFLYALPTQVFGVPLAITLIASKFFLPLALFVLIYALLYQLMDDDNFLSRKMSALAGAGFIVLGYDLIDYRTVLKLISGEIEPSGWLIWTRSVNPILGAVFLFAFLLLILSIIRQRNNYKITVLAAGFFLALMFSSYFFSWGAALAVISVLTFFYLIKRDYVVARRLLAAVVSGLIFSSPYWYLSWQAKQSPYYYDSVLRSGLFFTHYPLINKFLVATLIIYLSILFVAHFFKKLKLLPLKDWHWFTLSLLIGGFLAFNQQIITGLTIWPYHFVQYTIPLAITAVMTVSYKYIYPRWPIFWWGTISFILLASLSFALYIQSGTYANALAYNRSIQRETSLFEWFNQQEPDCVVLVVGSQEQAREFNGLIPAFTHCNQYAYSWVYSLLPEDRIYHSYLVNIRLQGVTAEGIDDYLKQNRAEAGVYLSSNWKGLYGVKDFPDFTDDKLRDRLKDLSDDYRDFLKEDFGTVLQKYRLDYILSIGELPARIKRELPNITLIKQINEKFIYQFNPQ